VETIADFSSGSIEKLALDVTSEEDVQKVLGYIVEKEGRIDVVVNNAGIAAPGYNVFLVKLIQFSPRCS